MIKSRKSSANGAAVADRTNGNRDARAEAELAAAGIGPGHHSLFPDRMPIDEDDR